MEETSAAGQNEAPARRVNEIDTTGQTVAANVKRLRTEQGLTTAQLADRLEAAGRPILANAITKIEQRQRRVSVDDLMALAAALGATPNALLLPRDLSGPSQPTGLQGNVVGNVLWAWACGERPLPLSVDPAKDVVSPAQESDWEDPRVARFRNVAAPQSTSPDAFLRQPEALRRASMALTAIIQTTPQIADSLARQARTYADTWSKIAKVLEDNADDLKERTVDAAAFDELTHLSKAGLGK